MAAKAKKKQAKKAAAAKKRPQQTATKPKTPKKASQSAKRDARIDVFVTEYLVDLNGRRAAVAAGYSPDSARFQASRLLAVPEVQERVAKAMVERASRTGISAERVLERLWGIGTADARELSELHRGSCRYCWGEGNRYQRTPRELEQDRADWAKEVAKLEDPSKAAPFNEAGGVGYNPKNDPNPSCPECFGDGVERVVWKDTRDLSPAARMLYAGVKQTQHGLQVMTHDQKGALVDVGKHLGLFREKVELTGKDGKDLAVGVVVVPAKRPREEPEAEPALEPQAVEPATPARKTFAVRPVQ